SYFSHLVASSAWTLFFCMVLSLTIYCLLLTRSLISLMSLPGTYDSGIMSALSRSASTLASTLSVFTFAYAIALSLIEKSFRYLAKIARLGEFWSSVLRHYGKDV